jgi:hypothetical protein
MNNDRMELDRSLDTMRKILSHLWSGNGVNGYVKSHYKASIKSFKYQSLFNQDISYTEMSRTIQYICIKTSSICSRKWYTSKTTILIGSTVDKELNVKSFKACIVSVPPIENKLGVIENN